MSTKEVKKQSGFNVWYNSPQGQRLVGAIYSLGAAVVIVGALFKIMHWPFAGIILTAGMFTEAILFSIGVFEKPHKTYHWENMFPSLLGDGKAANAADVLPAVDFSSNPLQSADAQKLQSSIKHLSDTASHLTTLTDVADTSDKFAKNLTAASDAAASFATKQQNLDSVSDNLIGAYQSITTNLSNVSTGTKQYADKSDALNNSLSAINSVYELQLKNIQAQSDSLNVQTAKVAAVTADLEKMLGAVNNSAKDLEAYRQQTEKLAKQVSDLNTIYGNMLNAIHN